MENTLEKFLTENGYENLKEIPGRGICGITRFAFTTGLIIGLEDWGYFGRYCYDSRKEAEDALSQWDGIGDPPGEWIKYKGEGGERSRKREDEGKVSS
jgi:hypothetical protein